MTTPPVAVAEPKRSAARERLLSTAAGIFYAEGIRTVGVERIIAEASVTKATFYRHFPSKTDLALAYLRSVDTAIRQHLESAAETAEPLDVLRIVGGGIAEEVCRPGFRGCAFINAAAEYSDPDDPVRQLVKEHRDWFEQFLIDALTRAGHPNPQGAANHVGLMRDGAMVRGYLSDPVEAGQMLMRGIEGTIRFIRGEWPEPPPA